jgi:50S ribosomal protein L4
MNFVNLSTVDNSSNLSLFSSFLKNLNVDLNFLHNFFKKNRVKNFKPTAHTKTTSEVSGTTRKPHNQKGGGRARQGSKRANHHRGGGVAFGPKLTKGMRNIKINSSESYLSRLGYYSLIAKKNNLLTFDSSSLANLKSSEVRLSFIDKFKDSKLNILVVCSEDSFDVIYKSLRNVVGFDVIKISRCVPSSLAYCDVLCIDSLCNAKSLISCNL